MLVNEQLFDAVCADLGINAQVGQGSMYLSEEGACRKITNDDFDEVFGFLKSEPDTVFDSINYTQDKMRIINVHELYGSDDSMQLLYAS